MPSIHTKESDDYIRAQWPLELSLKEIAAKLGMHHSTVSKRRKTLGLPARQASAPKKTAAIPTQEAIEKYTITTAEPAQEAIQRYTKTDRGYWGDDWVLKKPTLAQRMAGK